MTRTGLVSYDGLPVASGGGHGLGRLTPQHAWDATRSFLGGCTTAALPSKLTLAINSVEDAEPGLSDRLRESAVATLGLHPSPHDRRGYGAVTGSTLLWRLSPEQIVAAVAWRESLGPLRADWLGGPALLSMDFAFRFRTATGDGELPFQGAPFYREQPYDGYGVLLGESGCRLNLGARSTLSVLFFLPFEDVGSELWEYVAFLEAKLPFKISPKHWKHWRLTKKGTSYVGRRVKRPSLGPRAA
jgi:hypothetical protein